MPPPGGYKDIEWARVTRKPVSGTEDIVKNIMNV
jgi:hypothetical protein